MLGRIGSCVGHEISHAFDFRGSQMDHYGRPGSIFTDEDVETFLKTCDDLAAYYDTIEYMPGQFVNGKRVNVEAAADLKTAGEELRDRMEESLEKMTESVRFSAKGEALEEESAVLEDTLDLLDELLGLLEDSGETGAEDAAAILSEAAEYMGDVLQ